jgi:asparagine synthase (glutamine-hydrolysing)
MCGITGFWDPALRENELDARMLIQRMSGALARRGPDGHGAWTDDQFGVALGHRRLAIVDLTENGAQPMESVSGRYVLTYNGEVYNAPALRLELEAHGARFRGRSDTEVMLQAIERWGLRTAVERFAGMFAFAVWDRRRRELTLARDRLGEKPLYYGFIGSRFVFASDLAAFHAIPGWDRRIDPRAVDLFLRANYIPSPLSIFAGIAKLPPASILVLDEQAIRSMQPGLLTPFWSLAEVALRGEAQPFRGSDRDAVEALDELLRQVLNEQFVADVPVGALLSGGIDSSTVVALGQQLGEPIHTFTMGTTDPAYDESSAAAAIASHLGTRHQSLEVTDRQALELIPQIPEVYTEPFADSSQIPTTLLLTQARKSVTVCLTGDGGDEVFCGYNRHVQLARLWDRFEPWPAIARGALGRALNTVPATWYGPVLRMANSNIGTHRVQKLADLLNSESMEAAYCRLASQWPVPTPAASSFRAEGASWLLDDPAAWPPLKAKLGRIAWVEAMTSLPDQMLVKVDRAAMYSSLETRAPLLDHRIVEFAWQLPWELRVRNGQGKWILRRLLADHVPASLMDRPKQGFAIPIGDWLVGPLREWAESLLAVATLEQSGLLQSAPIRQAWREHTEGRRRWDVRIWSILMFQAWWAHQAAIVPRTS